MTSAFKKYRMPVLDLNQPLPVPTTTRFALVGFACDEGVRRNNGRPGAIDGPSSLRALLDSSATTYPLLDCGDISCFKQDLESAQEALGKAVASLLSHRYVPIIVGGGHELSWGVYQGIQKVYPGECQIINYDAHYDLRPLVPAVGSTSGTSFTQIAEHCNEKRMAFHYSCVGLQPESNSDLLKERAAMFQAETIPADALAKGAMPKYCQEARSFYLSICLDVFAADAAPGVSAPQKLGVAPHIIQQQIPLLLKQVKVPCIFSIAELAPIHDKEDRTTKLTASLISAFCDAFSVANYENI